jgi:hypothetical protein
MLAPHKSLDSFATLPSRLAADAKYLSDGASVLDAPADDPVYVRFENSLLVAFDGMPAVDIPTKSSSRVFELRTYESHSRKFGKKKIEMFNTAEIDVFLKTGLHPVFFGESIVGPNLPNLVYMLAFEEMAQREKAWDVFGSSPEWKELRSRPEFAGTVSNINVKILKPTGYSQI